MRDPLRYLAHLVATAAVLSTIALGLVPSALGDDWARDRAGTFVARGLDPAIRAAVAARAPAPAPVLSTIPSASEPGDGFAWGAAALGLGVGIAGMCAVLVCVSLVRSDGRLRNA